MPLLLQHGTSRNMKKKRVEAYKLEGDWKEIASNVTTYRSYFDIDPNKMLKKNRAFNMIREIRILIEYFMKSRNYC